MSEQWMMNEHLVYFTFICHLEKVLMKPVSTNPRCNLNNLLKLVRPNRGTFNKDAFLEDAFYQ